MATVSPTNALPVSTTLQTVGGSLKRSLAKAPLPDSKPKCQRTRTGCFTCRLRGKKCDEQKVDNGESCGECKRLRLHCLGFQDRPAWLGIEENRKTWRNRVTEFLYSQGLIKGRKGCGLQRGSDPEAFLTLEDMRRGLDASGAGPNPDAPSAPLQRTPSQSSEIANASNQQVPGGEVFVSPVLGGADMESRRSLFGINTSPDPWVSFRIPFDATSEFSFLGGGYD